MNHILEFDEKCKSCNGTGLYIGIAEKDGAAVVCYTCKGTGCHHVFFEYEDFKSKQTKPNVKRVYQANPGIVIGTGKEKQYKLEEFGGMPYKDWIAGKAFKIGMENRKFTCPAWWYQSTDYTKKPKWCKEYGCFAGISFSSYKQFKNKDECWKRFDKDNK